MLSSLGLCYFTPIIITHLLASFGNKCSLKPGWVRFLFPQTQQEFLEGNGRHDCVLVCYDGVLSNPMFFADVRLSVCSNVVFTMSFSFLKIFYIYLAKGLCCFTALSIVLLCLLPVYQLCHNFKISFYFLCVVVAEGGQSTRF